MKKRPAAFMEPRRAPRVELPGMTRLCQPGIAVHLRGLFIQPGVIQPATKWPKLSFGIRGESFNMIAHREKTRTEINGNRRYILIKFFDDLCKHALRRQRPF
jgi:hypothetical protein